MIPRLAKAAACNPCAATKRGCGACNPCAAKKRGCGACNPCAAKKRACNPCNPCAAKNPCGGANPCNPCGGNAQVVEIKDSEATAAYNCLKGEITAAYAKAGVKNISGYLDWPLFNKAPYIADTHGGRLVNNYSNKVGAKAYGRYEKIGKAPVGTVLMKDSFVVKPDGKLAVGPGFIMEKMKASFSKPTMNWKYSMILPNGSIFGVTGGKNSKGMTFCHECHGAAEDEDALRFLPEEYRK